MTGLRNDQITGKTLFLGETMRVLPEEISIWISSLSKAICCHPMWVGIFQFVEGPNRTKMQKKKKKKEQIIFFLNWISIYFSCPRTSELLDLGPSDSGTFTSSHLVLRSLTETELYHWLSWLSSLQTEDCGTSQPP